MDEKLRTILAELRRRFEALYGERLVQMVLFGSQARGDAKPGSDIDVLVVLKDPVHPGDEVEKTGGIVAELSLQYAEVISCVFIGEDRFRHRYGPLLRNIRREGMPI
jgi:predicted nucleotidyltransferase